jgi:hypothetical protein
MDHSPSITQKRISEILSLREFEAGSVRDSLGLFPLLVQGLLSLAHK